MGGRKGAVVKREESERAWADACAYALHLARGNAFPRGVAPGGLILDPGEYACFTTAATYQRWYGMNVGYQRSSTFAFGSPAFVVGSLAASAVGNAMARSKAQAAAMPQWRETQQTTVLATDRRFLVQVWGQGWLSFWFSGVQEFYPEVYEWRLIMCWPGSEPLQLLGLAAPYLAVHAAAAIMPGRWTEEPRLQALLPQDR